MIFMIVFTDICLGLTLLFRALIPKQYIALLFTSLFKEYHGKECMKTKNNDLNTIFITDTKISLLINIKFEMQFPPLLLTQSTLSELPFITLSSSKSLSVFPALQKFRNLISAHYI